MLLRRAPSLTPRRLTIRLDDATWARLDALQRRAKDAGMDLAIEEALADYLTRQIARAERDLDSARVAQRIEGGGGPRSAPAEGV